jgi:hypothetical protein
LRRQLHQEIETEIKDALGPEAEVDELLVLPGSVEILAIISTVSMVVTNFNALTDNLEKATERVRRAVRFVLGRIQPIRAGKVEYRIHGDWTPGPAMRRVQRSGAQSPPILAPANSPEQPAVAGGSGLFSPYAGALAGAYGLLLAIIIMLAILVGRG